ncbi:carbohydrate kinase family protein [Spiroplasma floricola]|uniref:Fructokinase n=1 Tax=Spiroplasma floricola 23-6 TaxID=1336749 RepID=A0A2K8SE18_9MOLU|nr:carbohydrate kinase [Spiroplasma floricola]AUB31585.1 fructokinase [Spiroplasma floricola 23-6]
MKKIISIGEVLMDVYSTNEVNQAIVGGASFNVACSIAALKNNESYFMGSLGNDNYKEDIKLFIEKFGIKTDFIQHSELPTTIAKVTLDENKERFFEFIRNSDADFHLSKFSNNQLKKIDFVHFGSATGLLDGDLNKSYWDLFKFVKDNNIKFCFDPNFRDKLWKTESEIKQFIKLCKPFLDSANLIKLSDEELLLISGMIKEENALKSLMKSNPNALICITRGSKETMCGWKNEIIYVPTIECKEIADTTGAGDAFISCLINEFVSKDIEQKSSKEEIIEIISTSNKFANKAVRYLGALTFLDHLD